MSRGRGIFLAGSLLSINVQSVAGARHGHIKQAPLVVIVECLELSLGYGVRIPKIIGELNQSLAIGDRETSYWWRGE